tara:strand:- start:24 stop:167 length:144 start_codon:yes stop_codon:yes gene_type:complete
MVRGKSFDEVFGITEVGEDIFGKTFEKLWFFLVIDVIDCSKKLSKNF